MESEYLLLPLALDKIMYPVKNTDQQDSRQLLAKCSLQESVEQHLRLIYTTAFSELPGDPNFGCGIWEHDFDNVASGYKLKELFRQSLSDTIQQYEKRLRQVRVEVGIHQQELPASAKTVNIKKRIDIVVSAVYTSTNEKFNYRYSFFIGPLSY